MPNFILTASPAIAAQGGSLVVLVGVFALFAAILFFLGFGILQLIRRADRQAADAVNATLDLSLRDLEAEKTRLGAGFDPGPNVSIEVYTYAGFLFWTSEAKHRFVVPKEFALFLLKRVHWYNIRHGLLDRGGLLIPFISWIHFHQQRRSVLKQASSADNRSGSS